MLNFLKAHWMAIPTAILAIVAVGFMIRGKEAPVAAYTVTLLDLSSEVSVSGKVTPAEEVSLAFGQAGQVARVNVRVGQRVSAGAVLASLDNGNLSAQVAQAEASVKIEQAALEMLRAGSRAEDVGIALVKVDTARQTLDNKKNILTNQVASAYSVVENNFRYYVDQLFTNPRSDNPELNIQLRGEYEFALEEDRIYIETALAPWPNPDVAQTSLTRIRDFVALVATAINELSATAVLSSGTVAGYKADMSIMRSSIETELENVSAAERAFIDAGLALELAQDEYNLAKSPARPEDIDIAQAKLAKAIAEVSRLRALMRERVIYAPFTGLVSKQEYKVGETVSAGDARINLISDNNFQIEANIPEADIASVAVGQVAVVTLDAYPETEIFNAHVVGLDPAETVIDGVPTYRTTLVFDKRDERAKAGMTANVVITTDTRGQVLAIPNRLIERRDGKSFVLVGNSDEVKEREVQTGLRSADGYTEIVSGLSAGEQLIDGTTSR